MSLSATWSNDWAHPYPFRVIHLYSEHDADLGQWSVQFALLGIGVELTWVYDPDTPLRRDLAEFSSDEWLAKSRVSMPFADYEALKADADKWRESQNGTGREKGA